MSVEPIIIVIEHGMVDSVSGPLGVPIVVCDYDVECATEDEIDVEGSDYHTLPNGDVVAVYQFDQPPVEYEPLIKLAKEAVT